MSVRHPLYGIWSNMKTGCLNVRNHAFPRYGGAGISICRRWLSFKNFVQDMGARPSLKHTIERKDGRLGYSPSNCRWATYTEQNRNRRDNVNIRVRNETKTASEWAFALGITPEAVYKRIALGWSPERAAITPKYATRRKA